MFTLTNRDYATLIMDSGTIIMALCIIFISFRHRKKDRPDEDSFLVLLILNIILALGDSIAYLSDGKIFSHSIGLATFGMTVFYAVFLLITMSWMHYCRVKFRSEIFSEKSHFAYEYLPGMIFVALVFINVFTGWIFRYDESNLYHRGALFIPMYVILAAYIIAGFIYLSKYRDRDSGKARIPIWVFAIPMVFGAVFTFLVPGSASFAPVGVAMSFVFTHMGTVGEE